MTCENGTTYIADHVIFTGSLGVLKHSADTLFSPPLPIEYTQAIQGLNMDTVDKLFLEFDDLYFLPNGVADIWFYWDDDQDEVDECELVSMVDDPNHWCRKIVGFFMLQNTPLNLMNGMTIMVKWKGLRKWVIKVQLILIISIRLGMRIVFIILTAVAL